MRWVRATQGVSRRSDASTKLDGRGVAWLATSASGELITIWPLTPLSEVASILGVKEATIKTRVHRARLALRKTLAEDLPRRDAPHPDHSRQVCLDLLGAKQEALDRGVDFPVPPEELCTRCKSLFSTLDLTYDACQPRCYFNSSTGYGTLGYGLPAAVGAKLACPDQPVAAIVGDGGLLFTIGELATAVELELALPILVWNNRGYGEIKRYMEERGIALTGVELYTPDLQAVARGFGCLTERPLTLERFATALRRAFATNRPMLIQIDEELALRW